MKINVVGTSGSGKSTLCKKLSAALDIPYIEIDRLFWKPNWIESNDEEFFSKLEQSLDQDSWVLDGNYTRTIPIKWKHVDMIIWIDFSYTRTLLQALKRALIRASTKQELWPDTGNRETFKKLFSRQSIVLWTIKTYAKNKKKYQAMMADARYSRIKFVRVRSPKEADSLIESLSKNTET